MERSIVPGRLSERAFGSWIYNLKVVFPVLHVPHLEPPNQTPFDLSSSVGILLCITGQVIELLQINYTEYSPSSALPSSGKAPSSGQNPASQPFLFSKSSQ